MDKFNLPKGLLDTVSGIVKSSKQQQAEQSTQFSTAMREKAKVDTIKPLTAEQLAAVPKREQKDLALYNTIRGIASTSAEQAAAELQTAEGRINSMYRTSGGRGRSLAEGKAHTVPKTEKEKQLAALATPKDKITHKDVMVGRGVVAKEEVEQVDEMDKSDDNRMKGPDRTAKPTTIEKIKSFAKKALEKAGHGDDEDMKKDLRKKMGMKEESEQVNEISAELATSYLNKRDSQPKPDMNTPETNVRASKVAKGIRGAVSRMHGYGRDKNAENKVTGRFEYRKNVGATHVFNKEETEHVEEGWDDMLKSVKDLNKPQPNGGSGVKKGTRYGGANQKDEKPVKEETDTPGNSYAHQCAIHVKHAKLGEGKTLFSQHAEPNAQGEIAWYDVMFEHGIEKKVPTTDLEIVVSESHMNHKKKKM